MFRIDPDPELLGYVIQPEPADYAATSAYLESIGCRRNADHRFNALVLHYQGNTSPGKKNLDHGRAVCNEAVACGYIPVILDWDHRSPLPDDKTIFCPGVHAHDIRGTFGSGDAARIAALVSQSALFVGIDSGPAKAAAATSMSQICVWTGHHPIQFHDLSKTHHLVPEDHQTVPPAQNQPAADYFKAHYDFSTYPRRNLAEKLCSTIRKFLGREPTTPTGDPLTLADGFWRHADRAEQDVTIIEDVFVRDCYKIHLLEAAILDRVVDVGAHIGTFARLMNKMNPAAKIVCLEVAPENIEPLRRNTHGIAEVIHACVVGEKSGAVKLLNSFVDVAASRSTGGSAVVPADEGEPKEKQYRVEPIACETLALRAILDRLGWPHIDLLKLDCEGSEYAILHDAPLEKIRLVVGEYHGFERWEAFRRAVFADWEYGHMSRAGDVGNFHLRNPRFQEPTAPLEAKPPAVPAAAQSWWDRLPEGGSLLFVERETVEAAMQKVAAPPALYHPGGLWEIIKGTPF